MRYNILAMEKYYYINTYGCQMNVHESEKLAGILEKAGYSEAKEEAAADIIVFNTCCIRDTAEKKILGNLGDVKRFKKLKPSLIVAVVGCMTQQKGAAESLRKRFPYVDVILGTANLSELGEALRALSEGNKNYVNIPSANAPCLEELPARRSGTVNAWVNIMYGCDNFCSYCIVPYVRGRERSRPFTAVLDEIKALLGEGYREITLLGQNVDSYNDGGKRFSDILKAIDKIDGKFRVRFMTSHPKDFNSEVIDIIASSDKICNNIHLPVQSGNDRILKLMNRKYSRSRYLDIISEIRAKIPSCGITSDVMAGFPTETDEEFRDTISLVEAVRFSSAFTFVYSPRKGTVAAEMEQLPFSVKKERITELVRVQNEISASLSKDYIGTTQEILVEDVNPKKIGFVCGRTDSGRLVNFPGGAELVGNFERVEITSARCAALWGNADG